MSIIDEIGPHPTLEFLWQLANYDTFFYVGLAARYGYIPEAYLSKVPPTPIKPFIAPRPVPAYAGPDGSVGLFENVAAPDF